MSELLAQIWYNPDSGFQSAVNLRKAFNNQKSISEKAITLKAVKEWLSKQDVNQRGKNTKRPRV